MSFLSVPLNQSIYNGSKKTKVKPCRVTKVLDKDRAVVVTVRHGFQSQLEAQPTIKIEYIYMKGMYIFSV